MRRYSKKMRGWREVVRFNLYLLCALIFWTSLLGCSEHADRRDNGTFYLSPMRLGKTAAPPKGLVIITVDTLRADHLSCYGHPEIFTPNIDRLAQMGQLFRNAVSQASTTTPSHASLFTSLYLQDHNVYSNFEALGESPRMLAEHFSGRGFRTFSIANMKHLNPEVSNLDQGIDTAIRSGYFRKAGPSLEVFFKWLDEVEHEKFYAWIHLADVHTPYRPPSPYDRLYYDANPKDPEQSSLATVWPLLPNHMSDHPFFQQWLDGVTDLEWVLAQYQGSVSYVDEQVGRLLAELEGRDILDSTAIVLTSDHGEALGEHDMYFVHTGLYESTVRIPLISYLPGAPRTGVQIDALVESVDVMPTLLDYFGFPVPARLRGRSLWPQIEGAIVTPKIAFIEHAGRNLVALRNQRYKYIKHERDLAVQPSYPFVRGREELYDLIKDPIEAENLAALLPETTRAFREELRRRRQGRFDYTIGEAEINEDTEEMLRALGYMR